MQGEWSQTMRDEHIATLDLIAVSYALQVAINTFGWSYRHVQITVDSTTARAAIQRRGSQTPMLRYIARRICLLAHRQRLTLSTAYIHTSLNTVPDLLSRRMHPNAHWSVSHNALQAACQPLRCRPSIDLFASSHNTKLPRFVSLRPEPSSAAADAFSLDWARLPPIPYVAPPLRLIPRVLRKIIDERATVLLAVPSWPTASWWPLFHRLTNGHITTLSNPLRAYSTTTSAPTTDTIPTRLFAAISFAIVSARA